MKRNNLNQNIVTKIDNKLEVSKIKRDCYAMMVTSRKGEEDGYYEIVETLENLSYSIQTFEDYKKQLICAINEMIEVDNIHFNIERLYGYRNYLSA